MKALPPIATACMLALLSGAAAAQEWASAGVSKMTAAYDPAAGAVVLDEPSQPRMVDYHVTPAAVYQPPGRAYAIDDRFGSPVAAAPPASTAIVAPPGAGYGAAAPYAAPYSGALPPGASVPSYNACPPASPHACAPVYGQPAPVMAPSASLFPARPAHAEIEGRMGDPAEVLQGNLMLPFWQQQNSFWFLDLRGQYDDERAGEGNFGFARRQLLDNGLISTFYGFYDIRHSAYNNNFQQGMVGYELMSLEWEYRVNGYLPFTGTQTTGQNIASLDSANNIVVQQGLERAYYGMDAEYGLLFSPVGSDNEYRGYIGGYWFDTNEAGFETIAGPRARLEGRCYDLPYLGAGSRFTYGISYQWDKVRESQWIASANLRIPFGRGARAATKLSPIERRMLSAIRRTESIVTGGAFGAAEQAVISSTGAVASNVTVVNSGASAVADVAAGGDIVVVTDNINIAATGPIALNPNQFIGGQFDVEGLNSGAQATFGRRYTVSGDAANNVIQLADNSTVTGLTISGGANGIGGNNVTGFRITNNAISGAANAGVNLENLSGGDIIDNTFTGGGVTASGLVANTLLGTSEVSGNSFSGFTNDGARVSVFNGGRFSGNTASGNGADGIQLTTVLGGDITGNGSSNNGGDGFEVSDLSGGVFSANTASGNGDDGIDFLSSVTGGSITGNTATGNSDQGFAFAAISAGAISQNSASGNSVDGFQVASLTGGDFQFNTSNANTDDGFQIGSFTGGTFSNNSANNNTDAGYDVTGAGGAAADNTGSGNGSNNVFP
ncbi:hypothetical protein KOR34_31310 [Posidoniimonas corsicana]|uniref:Uncharacterized protein n=1 Tax=Posidoniimonas corsicana TaxID=1938618 RepID=A0A5C5VJJ6_9BACT|nr:right-handed parallel beta-helix repeat-containing protein [Posidoniimonas corsicana]TWT38163.1 hypothetical protein KOR34_31310 [Posidoniimonas corsicana]